MAIRINLLAEAQALEEMRRRDPVKRAIWIGTGLVAALLIWEAKVEMDWFRIRSEVNTLKAKQNLHESEFKKIKSEFDEAGALDARVGALTRLATNRFLNGTFLNAIQHTMVDNVLLLSLKADENFNLIAGTENKTNAGKITLGKPGLVKETISLTLRAKAAASDPLERMRAFKQAIHASPYFQELFGKTNQFQETSVSAIIVESDGRKSVNFNLACEIKSDKPERESGR